MYCFYNNRFIEYDPGAITRVPIDYKKQLALLLYDFTNVFSRARRCLYFVRRGPAGRTVLRELQFPSLRHYYTLIAEKNPTAQSQRKRLQKFYIWVLWPT